MKRPSLTAAIGSIALFWSAACSTGSDLGRFSASNPYGESSDSESDSQDTQQGPSGNSSTTDSNDGGSTGGSTETTLGTSSATGGTTTDAATGTSSATTGGECPLGSECDDDPDCPDSQACMGCECQALCPAGETCLSTEGGMACIAPSSHCALLCNDTYECPDEMVCMGDSASGYGICHYELEAPIPEDPDSDYPIEQSCPSGYLPAPVSLVPGGVFCSPQCNAQGECPSGASGSALGECLFNPLSSGTPC